jgi:dienelactone hydrolase
MKDTTIHRQRGLSVVLLALMIAGCGPQPPLQPRTGPGGRDYPHAQVRTSEYGQGVEKYWIFEPAAPAPRHAPLVIFLPGWLTGSPDRYQAWIDHITRRGAIVVFPLYHQGVFTSMDDFQFNAFTAIGRAIERLRAETGRVRPRLDRVAVVGHSAGGMMAANLAAVASQWSLPQPDAVMCVQPGVLGIIPNEDWSQIPHDTLLLSLASADDIVVGDRAARQIVADAEQIPAAHRYFVWMESDHHGWPHLSASHEAPLARSLPEELAEGRMRRSGPHVADALDFYGFWKLFDGLCAAAWREGGPSDWLSDDLPWRFMGRWADGQPVVELQIETAETLSEKMP